MKKTSSKTSGGVDGLAGCTHTEKIYWGIDFLYN